MSLVHLLRQFPLPGAGCQGRGEPPDADGVAQGEPSQPLVADALQRGAQYLIVLLRNPVRIVLPELGCESGEHLSNQRKLPYQRIALA